VQQVGIKYYVCSLANLWKGSNGL